MRALYGAVRGGVFGLCCAATLTVSAQQYPHVVESEPLAPAEQQKRFHLPEGFEIELVASEPEIAKPMNLNFDHRGRLLVTQSVEYPYAADERPGRDAVRMLEDRDGDGRFETVTTRVDGLNIPIGVVPVADDTVVYSIPNILRCGKETRAVTACQVLFGPFGYEDTHGMNNGFTRWLDGWIYACHGFRNTSTVAGRDGNRVSMQSGHTYRFRADGSRIEHFTFGQVNPFGLCFDPLGNAYTADCHSKPMYQLIRGAYYPSFGKPDDGLGFGPTLIEHSHGSTGIGGIACYAAEQFPESYRDNLFVGNPITHRVNRDRLHRHGATYVGEEMEDFLTCDDPWFRPVDLQLGPDGALYVADFYNRIIGHYEVPLDHPQRDRFRGRIWRIVYRGDEAKPAPDPAAHDLTRLSLEQLWQRLGDSNLTVRTLATHEIVDRFGERAVSSLQQWISVDSQPTQRAHGLWALERLGGLTGELVERLANDASPLVRVHLTKAIGERDWAGEGLDHAELARRLLQDEDAFVRRAAAESLGLHPNPENVRPLLELWAATPAEDTHLIHVTRIALRNQLQRPGVYSEIVARLARNEDAWRRLLDVSLGVPDARSAEFIVEGLQRVETGGDQVPRLLAHAARHLPADKLPLLADRVLAAGKNDLVRQAALLRTVHGALQERKETLPAALRDNAVSTATQLVDSRQNERRMAGLELVRELHLKPLYTRLVRVAIYPEEPAPLRIAALQACSATRPEESLGVFRDILNRPEEPESVRVAAAQALADVNTDAARGALTESLQKVHYRLAVEIAAALARSRAGAEELLQAVGQGRATPRLLQEGNVRQALVSADLPDVAERLEQLTAELPPLNEQLRQLIAERRAGIEAADVDPAAGRQVFVKNCAACHRVGNEGNKVGPELDGIGNRGLDRVLEDVLDPSRNVDPNFRTTIVETADGRVYSGLALREQGEVLILIDSKGQEQRVELDEIEQRKVLPQSPMPANVVELVKETDFYHLIGFLLDQQQTAE